MPKKKIVIKRNNIVAPNNLVSSTNTPVKSHAELGNPFNAFLNSVNYQTDNKSRTNPSNFLRESYHIKKKFNAE
jgi:hypothetical protein